MFIPFPAKNIRKPIKGIVMNWEYATVKSTVIISKLYSVFEDYFNTGHCFAGEAHEFWECVYVVDGEISVSADGRVYRLEQGDIIFHKPWEFHCFTVESPSGARLRIFSFRAQGAGMARMAQCVCHLHKCERNILDTMYAYAKTLRPLQVFADWHKLLHQADHDYAEMMSLYICQLIVMLAQREECIYASDMADAQFFRRAVEYMNEHIGTPLKVAKLPCDGCFKNMLLSVCTVISCC